MVSFKGWLMMRKATMCENNCHRVMRIRIKAEVEEEEEEDDDGADREV